MIVPAWWWHRAVVVAEKRHMVMVVVVMAGRTRRCGTMMMMMMTGRIMSRTIMITRSRARTMAAIGAMVGTRGYGACARAVTMIVARSVPGSVAAVIPAFTRAMAIARTGVTRG